MSQRDKWADSRPIGTKRRKPRSKQEVPLIVESEIHAVRTMREAVHDEIITLTLHRLRLASSCETLSDGWQTCSIPNAVHYFKVVAAHKGRLCSIFDGSTEYHMGRWLVAKRGASSWPPLDACYYAHSAPEAAVAAVFPRSSKLFKAPRVLLQVLVKGKAYQGPDDIWAFSMMQPVCIVSDTWVKGTVVVDQGWTHKCISR